MKTPAWITVVSGLPRSGTSLMMQVLVAGGIPALTDDRRPPDASNPRGYLEWEAAKRLKTDRAWLPQAQGRAVKIIHLLLPELALAPSELQFRIVLMRRPLEEVLASQRAMLARQNRPAATLPDSQLGAVFVDQMRRAEQLLAGRENFRFYEVPYPDLVRNPEAEIDRVNSFLGGGWDTAAMAQAVDPALYRERGAAGSTG